MIYYLQFQKIICVFLIFIILICSSGCYSYKVTVSKTDLPLTDNRSYYYLIHKRDSIYLIRNGKISNGILSGKMEDLPAYNKDPYYHNKIHIYLSSDTMMKISHEKIISIPIDGIVRSVAEKVEFNKTILLAIAIAGGGIILYYGIITLIFKNYSIF